MGIPGIWWVDLQIDGVKRGHLSQQPASRVPHPGSVIAASFTSPIDALYLAAVFDPIFTVSYPGTHKIRRISLFRAIVQALSPVQQLPPGSATEKAKSMTSLSDLLSANPGRIIVVFPECSTTNGKGVLPLSPSLLDTPLNAKIFPVSLRYTPPDITTPVPSAWAAFLWKLLSRPTHCVRVRIAEGIQNNSGEADKNAQLSFATGSTIGQSGVAGNAPSILDRVAEALARLGRNKRVGLTLQDKEVFVKAWKRSKRR
ncbi:MAG: Lysophosphatidic acid:oleoyl-CoA acyltransferase 1 [Sporothrix epigloea]